MNEIVNTMASGATSGVTQILSWSAGSYVYFGLSILLLGVGYKVFTWFTNKV